jgi:hypothetical protein
MKNIIYNFSSLKSLKLFCFFTVLILQSCSDRDVNKNDTNLDKLVNLKESTNLVTPFLYNIGAKGLNVSESNNQTSFEINFDNNVSFKKDSHPLNGKIVILKNGYLSLKGNTKSKIFVSNEGLHIISDEYNGLVNNVGDNSLSSQLSEDLGILIVFYKEITSNVENKIDTKNVGKLLRVAGCSMSDYHIIYSVNFTKAAAEAGLANLAMAVDGVICRQLTGIETSCVGDNHGCVSTTTWCCD